MTRDDPFDLVGDVLDGQYRIDSVAGEGDLSVVYKGHHLGVDAPAAIKCLNLPATLDPALVQPLVDDFRAASRVHYQLARGSLHIAQSLGSGQTVAPRTGATVPYLVREWFEGESLAADLARRRSDGQKGRSVEEAMALLGPAVEGIAYAHEQGTPHLSVNPSNLFIAQREGTRSLKVLDFGVARTLNELASELPADRHSTRGLRVLFPAYAAPEQLDRKAGEPGTWTDVYAIALVFMELLSDRAVMHETETGALVERALDEKKRPTAVAHGLHLSRNLELVLARAVARQPAKRQRDAAALWRDVRSALRGSASRSMPGPAVAVERQAPTLMGIAPGLAVVGAVPGRARAPSTPHVETKPLSFEPSVPSSSLGEPEPEPVPEPEPPKTVTAKLPPPLAPTPPIASSPWPSSPSLPRRAPSRVATAAIVAAGSLAMLALVVAVATFVVGSLHRQASAATAASPGAPSASPQGSGSPVIPSAVPAPVQGAPIASPGPADSVAAHSTARFPASAAKRAFDSVSHQVAACKRGARWGVANATVTFDTDGSVSQVLVGPPFMGTATGRCVSDLLGAVHIPPFGGDPVVYITRFYVAPR